MYLPDHFIYSLCIIQEEHPLSDCIVPYISTIVEIHDSISIIVEIYLLSINNRVCIWYNYLRSDSNKSVMFTPNAIAIISN